MSTNPATRPGATGKSPFLAAILSFIPGVGHLYVGLTTKGLTLLTITLGGFVLMVVAPMMTSMGPRLEGMVSVILYVLLIAPICLFYSIFDAYHAAKGTGAYSGAGGAGGATGAAGVGNGVGNGRGTAGMDGAADVSADADCGYPAANQHTLTWGIILTLTGLVSLAWSVGGYRMTYFLRLWPLVLVALGLLILAGNWHRTKA